MINLLVGDALVRLKELDDNSVHSVVCDPPYGLGDPPPIREVLLSWLYSERYVAKGGGFMGKDWDSFVPSPDIWRECFRVLRPGGYLLAFFGTRTSDLGGISIRLAGFERRDTVAWVYGSGFPKSLNIGKSIDVAAGAEREVVGPTTSGAQTESTGRYGAWGDGITPTAPATPEAQEWDGWGTALKPAFEPIAVFRKPLSEKTVAANVLEHGAGGLNVGACRVGEQEMRVTASDGTIKSENIAMAAPNTGRIDMGVVKGRWPANMAHDGSDEVLGLFPETKSGVATNRNRGDRLPSTVGYAGKKASGADVGFGDPGSASRFFYCAKVSKAERNDGLKGATNNHPTLKPTALMRWLVRLVTVRGGTVLDPFMGSGSTGRAAVLENCSFVGCELDPDHVAIAVKRISAVTKEKIIESAPDLEAEAAKHKARTARVFGFAAALARHAKSG